MGPVDPVELPPRVRVVMDNGVPAEVISCSKAGIPNTTIISQVYYVDDRHVALSFQFFNKTIRNVRENPRACLILNDVEGYAAWVLQIRYDHSETEGAVFDAMDVAIEAIASATGMAGIFKLKAADIYQVLSIEKIDLSSNS
jgi:hypothetical protein